MNELVRQEGVSRNGFIELIIEANFLSGRGHVVVHFAAFGCRNTLFLGQRLVDAFAGNGLEVGRELEAAPVYLDIVAVGKLGQGFFKFALADVAERAYYVGPDVNFHIVGFLNRWKPLQEAYGAKSFGARLDYLESHAELVEASLPRK